MFVGDYRKRQIRDAEPGRFDRWFVDAAMARPSRQRPQPVPDGAERAQRARRPRHFGGKWYDGHIKGLRR